MVTAGNSGLGQRIMVLRLRRRMTREILASLVGRSSEWLRQVELHQRPVDRLSVLLRLAEVLRVQDVAGFLALASGEALPSVPPSVARSPETSRAIREALLGSWGDTDGIESPGVAHRVRQDYWSIWRSSARRYSFALSVLPDMLKEARALKARGHPGDAEAFADVHRFAASVLVRMGEGQLALVAIERGLGAGRIEDLASAGAVIRISYGAVLLNNDHADMAARVFRAAGEVLERRGATDDGCAVRALRAEAASATAVAEAARADAVEADRHLMAAEQILAGGPPDLACGSWETTLNRIRSYIRLGRYQPAIRLAERTDVGEQESRDWLAQFFLQIAEAQERSHAPVAAVYSLLQAEEASSEEIRFNPAGGRLAQMLLRHDNALVRRKLWAMLERNGLL
ncbi:helix-turn-helix domain-containing protein [Streptomyces griseus]|uniref:helix-turn-helix domain-containing protein n=1 Tax=Streptomyces griseus TaxID=1911 RepID=UPI0004CAE5F0|nr:helix-turn-helix domain-containing protein [Streptomyces griseus]